MHRLKCISSKRFAQTNHPSDLVHGSFFIVFSCVFVPRNLPFSFFLFHFLFSSRSCFFCAASFLSLFALFPPLGVLFFILDRMCFHFFTIYTLLTLLYYLLRIFFFFAFVVGIWCNGDITYIKKH